jgi:hypothetical protein
VTTSFHNDATLASAVRDGIARAAAVIGLAAVAAIHLVDLPGKLDETPYLFWMYLALIAACVALAGALWRSSDTRAWAAAAFVAVAVLIGYTLSRTTGLPQSSDDIGNWGEPLGIASLFVEGSLAALCGAVLSERRSSVAAAVPGRLAGATR